MGGRSDEDSTGDSALGCAGGLAVAGVDVPADPPLIVVNPDLRGASAPLLSPNS